MLAEHLLTQRTIKNTNAFDTWSSSGVEDFNLTLFYFNFLSVLPVDWASNTNLLTYLVYLLLYFLLLLLFESRFGLAVRR